MDIVTSTLILYYSKGVAGGKHFPPYFEILLTENLDTNLLHLKCTIHVVEQMPILW